MKPDFIENIEKDDVIDKGIDVSYESTHHLLMTFWSSYDHNAFNNIVDKIREKYRCFDDSFAKFIETDKGNLSIIDIPVNWLEIDYNRKSSHSIKISKDFLALLKKILYKYSPIIIVSFINKKKIDKNDVYCIFHQESIYKEEYSNDRCLALFDNIKEFAKENEWISFSSICDKMASHREDYVNKNVTNKEFFTIANLSSSKDIPQTAKDLMAYIIKAGHPLFLTQYDNLLPYHEEDPLPIPIFLKSPENMPDYNHIWSDVKDKDKDKYIPQGKVLGYYTRKDNKNKIDYPHIVLCPENIEECSGDISVDDLYALVLVHEMSHAILDKYYEYSLYHEIYEDWNIEKVEYWPNSLYSKAMEESLANMMALMWLKSFDDSKFKQAKIFIENKQTAIYKFGIHQYEAGVDWKKWRESNKQSSQKLENWFNQCFANGKIKEPIVYTKDIYDRVFE